MKRITGIAGIFTAALMLSLTGCGGGEEESGANYEDMKGEAKMASTEKAPDIFNAECPIMGGEVDPEVETVAYGGKTIGFCCDDCLGEWAALADEKKDEIITKMMTAAEEGMEKAGEMMEDAGEKMEQLGGDDNGGG